MGVVTVRYSRINWENGSLELIPIEWKEESQAPLRLRVRPCDLLELPDLIFPPNHPMPKVIRSVKKILAVYFRDRVKLILE